MQTVIKTPGSLVHVRVETLVGSKQTFFCHQHRPNSVFCKRHQKKKALFAFFPFVGLPKGGRAVPANRFTRAHINTHICFCYWLTKPHTVTVNPMTLIENQHAKFYIIAHRRCVKKVTKQLMGHSSTSRITSTSRAKRAVTSD